MSGLCINKSIVYALCCIILKLLYLRLNRDEEEIENIEISFMCVKAFIDSIGDKNEKKMLCSSLN